MQVGNFVRHKNLGCCGSITKKGLYRVQVEWFVDVAGSAGCWYPSDHLEVINV